MRFRVCNDGVILTKRMRQFVLAFFWLFKFAKAFIQNVSEPPLKSLEHRNRRIDAAFAATVFLDLKGLVFSRRWNLKDDVGQSAGLVAEQRRDVISSLCRAESVENGQRKSPK